MKTVTPALLSQSSRFAPLKASALLTKTRLVFFFQNFILLEQYSCRYCFRLQRKYFDAICRIHYNKTCCFEKIILFFFIIFIFLEYLTLKRTCTILYLQSPCPRISTLFSTYILTKGWIRPDRSSQVAWIIFASHSIV